MRFLENFPFGEGKGFGQKKFVLSLVDQMVTAYQFLSQSAQKSGHTDRHSIALRDRIDSLKHILELINTRK